MTENVSTLKVKIEKELWADIFDFADYPRELLLSSVAVCSAT